MAADGGNGLEFWRGRIEATQAQHEEELRKLWSWVADLEEDMARDGKDTAVSFAEIKTKLAVIAALAAAAGGVLSSVFQHAFFR
jgi:hypothetical protein